MTISNKHYISLQIYNDGNLLNSVLVRFVYEVYARD